MIASGQASNEIIRFLEELQRTSPDLPEAIADYWKKVIEAYKNTNLNRAKALCESMLDVLDGLRGSDGDFSWTDGTQGQVSILLGAICLGQKDWSAAIYYFEQGARRLRHWDYQSFESLAYFGQALTYKEQNLQNRKEKKKWSRALKVAQRALDVIRSLPVPNKSDPVKRLEERIRQEIKAITQASTDSITEGTEREVTNDAKDEGTESTEKVTEEDTQAKIVATPEEKPPTTRRRGKSKSPTRIPIVSNIAAGLGIITEDKIKDYLLLDDDYSNGADFGVEVVGDSMKGHGILPGDIVLIRQQPIVEMGEIAAMIITTPEIEALGTLKRYYNYEKPEGMRYWFLASNNPTSEHLVVIPGSANVKAIQEFYAREIRSGKMRNPIKYYEDAELNIAGKYVGLVRKTD